MARLQQSAKQNAYAYYTLNIERSINMGLRDLFYIIKSTTIHLTLYRLVNAVPLSQ
jgi:hypothetical protein